MSKFNLLVENILTDLNEGRIPKSAQYSNIEIDASSFASKLEAGDMNEFIEAWSSKKWLGGLSQERIKDILKNIADDLTEYPPRSFTELWSQIETKVRDAIPTRKDLVEKITRQISNLLTNPAFGLTKTVEAPAATEHEGEKEETSKTVTDESELSEVAEKTLEYIRQAEEPSEESDVVKYITSSFGKEENEANDVIKELIAKKLVEKQGNTLVAKEEEGGAILDTDEEPEETGDPVHDAELRRSRALEYDPDVEAAYREYLSTDYSSDNYNYND
jgi:hypothetical protein